MKKIMMSIMFFIIILSMQGCSSNNSSIDVLVSGYESLDEKDVLNHTSYDDGYMLGDAYYVKGTKNAYIESVNYYKGEYIYFMIQFDDVDDGILITGISIDYCDYEKDIYVSAHAIDVENPYRNQDIDYDELFNEIKNLSIQEMRQILTLLDLL
jgi:hypothetical protein